MSRNIRPSTAAPAQPFCRIAAEPDRNYGRPFTVEWIEWDGDDGKHAFQLLLNANQARRLKRLLPGLALARFLRDTLNTAVATALDGGIVLPMSGADFARIRAAAEKHSVPPMTLARYATALPTDQPEYLEETAEYLAEMRAEEGAAE